MDFVRKIGTKCQQQMNTVHIQRLSHQSSEIHLLISHSKYEMLFFQKIRLYVSSDNNVISSFVLLYIEPSVYFYNSKMCIYIFMNKIHLAPGRASITEAIFIYWHIKFLSSKEIQINSVIQQAYGRCLLYSRYWDGSRKETISVSP